MGLYVFARAPLAGFEAIKCYDCDFERILHRFLQRKRGTCGAWPGDGEMLPHAELHVQQAGEMSLDPRQNHGALGVVPGEAMGPPSVDVVASPVLCEGNALTVDCPQQRKVPDDQIAQPGVVGSGA